MYLGTHNAGPLEQMGVAQNGTILNFSTISCTKIDTSCVKGPMGQAVLVKHMSAKGQPAKYGPIKFCLIILNFKYKKGLGLLNVKSFYGQN